MDQEELDRTLESLYTVHPSRFSEFTIEESRRKLLKHIEQEKQKETEKQEKCKNQKLEQFLRAKPRKLLVVDSDS